MIYKLIDDILIKRDDIQNATKSRSNQREQCNVRVHDVRLSIVVTRTFPLSPTLEILDPHDGNNATYNAQMSATLNCHLSLTNMAKRLCKDQELPPSPRCSENKRLTRFSNKRLTRSLNIRLTGSLNKRQKSTNKRLTRS